MHECRRLDEVVQHRDRSHEVGYEDLTFEEFQIYTGLPRGAYEEWLTLDVESRRGVVGIFTTPEEIQAVREIPRHDQEEA